MPKLSQFRVVNLVYNETRHIYDEIFEFDQGMDTLLLLDNGGGKTVLTQMMMQPVIPKTDLKTRKFDDYFKNNSRPTLLINEWLLDDNAGRLLTGLVIQNVKRRRAQDIEENLQIVSFIIHTAGHEIYAIDNIPVASWDHQGRRCMRSLEEIVKDLERQSVKFPLNVQVYKWSDSRQAKLDYRKKILEYGISDTEWKDNILRINQEESGLKDFFNDARRSNTLIEKKFLPIIESRLNLRSGEAVDLAGMVEAHVKELVKYDEIIKEDKIYKAFLDESAKYRELIVASHEAGLKMNEVYHKHISLEDSLNRLKEAAIEGARDSEKVLANLLHAYNRILLEEEAYEYYLQEDDLSKLVNDGFQLEQQISMLKGQVEQAQLAYHIELARIRYADVRKIQEDIRVHEAKVEAAENQEELGRLEELEQVLLVKYQEAVVQHEEQLKVIHQRINEHDQNTKLREETIGGLESQQKQKQQQFSDLDYEIRRYEERIELMNRQNVDHKWGRHGMFATYEKDELDRIKAISDNELQELGRKGEGLQCSLLNVEAAIKVVVENQHIEEITRAKLEHELKTAQTALASYEETYSQQVDQLLRAGLMEDARWIFDKDRMHDLFSGALGEAEKDIHGLEFMEALQLQLLANLKEGRLSGIPDPVAKHLAELDIDYQFGYRWLMEYEGEVFEDALYLKQLPLLPYALVMGHKDWERLLDNPMQEYTSIPVPVITYEAIRSCLRNEGCSEASSGPISNFITNFESRLLEESYMHAKIDSLDNEIQALSHDRERLKEKYRNISGLKASHEQFRMMYDGNSQKHCLEAVMSKEQQLKDLSVRVNGLGEEHHKLMEEASGLRELIKAHKIKVHRAETTNSLLADLEHDFAAYGESLSSRIQLKETLERLEQQLKAEREALVAMGAEKVRIENEENQESNIIDGLKVKAAPLAQQYAATPVAARELKCWSEEGYEFIQRLVDEASRKLSDLEGVRKLIGVLYGQLSNVKTELERLNAPRDAYEAGQASPAEEKRSKDIFEELKSNQKKVENALIGNQTSTQDLRKHLDKALKKTLENYQVETLPDRSKIVDLSFSQRKKANGNEKVLVNQVKKSYEDLGNFIDNRNAALGQHAVPEAVRRKWQSGLEKTTEISKFMNGFKVVAGVSESALSSIKDLEEEVRSVVETHLADWRQQQKRVDTTRMTVKDYYTELKGRHRSGQNLVGRMFNQLMTDERCDEYHHVLSVLEGTEKSIRMTMDKYAADIGKIDEKERTIQDMVSRRVGDVYDELKDMDTHSSIELAGARRKMLFIALNKKELIDLTELHVYVRSVISDAKKMWLEKETLNMEKYLGESLSLKKLFDIYHPIGGIKVELTKIEKNQLSKISWEQVGKISGGEGFVSIFVVFITMLSYSRGYQMGRKQLGKVLVMDNPFGPVSSEHLLDPLFQIAKNYNTQMVCFTHLNNSSITRQFPKIYSLRVVKEMGSISEHIEVKVSDELRDQQEFVEASPFEIGFGGQIGLF